jgi:DNA-binding transcriptional regulator YdaS (Cro superfamily)
MNTAAHVIGRLGGTRKAAAILNSSPSTVQSWKKAGHIPAPKQAEVIEAAKRAGIEISAAEMIGVAA